MAEPRPEPRVVRVEGGTGVQIGSGNQQTNHYYAATGVRWPVRVGTVPMVADCYQERAVGEGLADTATTVITGMGGVGKTQVAARHVRASWTDPAVDLAVWITAVDRDAIVAGYAQAARAIGRAARDDDPAAAAPALVNWLATTDRRWVVVLDDVQDPGHVHGLWPPGGGRTIVTTRRRDAALRRTDRRIVEVDPYTTAESMAYLRSKVARPDLLDGAADLVAEMGGLPLALAQAAAFVQDVEITCAEYVRQFRAGRDVAPDALPDEHRHTVDRTWALSVERADELAPVGVARPLLELLSFLDPNGIPMAVVTTPVTLAYLGVRADRQVSAEDALRAVQVLRRLSLADTDQAQPQLGLRVHALVQRATRAAIERGPLIAGFSAQALLDSWPEIERDHLLGQALRANAAELMRHAQPALWSGGGHAVLHRYGRSLGEAGLAGSARDYFEHTSAVSARVLGADHPTTLTLRGELGTWRGYSGDVAGAVAELERLLADRVRLAGPEDETTLTTRHNLAYWRGESGDLAGAVAELDRQWEVERRVLGEDDPQTLTTRYTRALWRGHAEGEASVVAEFERLLADWERVRGADDPGTLTVRHELARCRGKAGDPAGAVVEFRRLVADQERVHGSSHPHTLTGRHELAKWRGAAGDVVGAVAEFELLLADNIRLRGPDHPDTLSTRSALLRHRTRLGDLPAVARGLEQLVADRTRVLGPDHPRTLTTRGNLATVRGGCGDVARAVAETEQLLHDQIRVLGPDHPDTRATREHLAFWRARA
ncbi:MULTISPECIES: tetratricopeptide repeat protein [Saccharothrix]|uniref:tetratricopeptide repeat protein n=1 Tax=Saccharothrix TaxID=2071 RepID=UPI001300EC3A|nr:tetratricopeptide repeat protein [Saccharothrix sp. CB00851]